MGYKSYKCVGRLGYFGAEFGFEWNSACILEEKKNKVIN
jgi:hypothetical protein